MATLVERVRALQGGLPLDAAALKQRKVHAPSQSATHRWHVQNQQRDSSSSRRVNRPLPCALLLSTDSVRLHNLKLHRS
jgi:hypothetical protein